MHFSNYHIGGADIAIEAGENGVIHLQPSGWDAAIDEANQNKPIVGTGGEIPKAMRLLEWMVANTYDARLVSRDVDGVTTYQAEPEYSPIGDFVESGKRVLSVPDFHKFMAALTQKFAEPKEVEKALDTLDQYAEFTKRFAQKQEATAQKDQREAAMKKEQAERAKLHLGYLMPPIRAVLSYDLIEMNQERAQDILLALRDAGAPPFEPSKQAEHYANAVFDYLHRNNLDIGDAHVIKDHLKSAIAIALDQKRQQGGRGGLGEDGKKAG